MARQRRCKVCDGWHDLSQPWPVECTMTERTARSDFPTPMMTFDTMDAVQSMTNGMYYDSKSQLRREYSRAGVEEVGNDVPMNKPTVDKEAQRKSIKASVGKALSRAGLGA